MKRLLLYVVMVIAMPLCAYDRKARLRSGGHITLAEGDPCWRYVTAHGYIEECPYYQDYSYFYRPTHYYPNWWVGYNIGRPYYGGYRRKHRTHYHRAKSHESRARRYSPPAIHGNRRISQSHVGAGYGAQGMIGTH